MNVDLQHLAPHFQFRGPIMAAIPYGSGHINDTYKVTVEQGGQPVNYIVQRVNHKVFTKTAELMRNIQRVTEHIRRKLEAIPGSDPSRETLTLIPTTDNNCFYQDKDGNFFIVGRKKDMIRRSAENIAAREVETVLAAAPGVAEVAVVGTDLAPSPLPEDSRYDVAGWQASTSWAVH